MPNDFNYDGRMDLMLMCQKDGDRSGETKMELWLGKEGSQVGEQSWEFKLYSSNLFGSL